jgi:GGDEF domain-containing protein
MTFANARQRDEPTLVPSAAVEPQFIVLGGPAPDNCGLSSLSLDGTIGDDCDGIILLKQIDPGELTEVLARAPDPALPIVDFFGNHPVRCDFAGSLLNADCTKEMHQFLAPIWDRLAEFPFRAQVQDRTGMTILRLVYSRSTPAKATFAPRSPVTVQYPLVGAGPGVRQHLELLATQDLLKRRHFTRTHACSKCASARLNIYEACPACGSSDLFEEALVHHYRCGCQEAESRFIQDDQLICPKCRRELRHLGVDYGKPGKIALCRSCGARNSMPSTNFICLDCSAVTPAEDAASTDWYHYDLTDIGLNVQREGRLPQSEFSSVLDQAPRAYSPREFQLLAMQELRVAQQYKHTFSVARISFPNLEAVRREQGLAESDAVFQRAVDMIVKTVRPRDFVGISGGRFVFIGLAAITEAGVRRLEDRIRKTTHDIEARLELTVEVAEGNAIVDLFARG